MSSGGSIGFASRADRQGLIHSYDEENGGFGLNDLTEESDGEAEERHGDFEGPNNSLRPLKGYTR